MIFTSLDFHLNTRYGEEPLPLHRPFRLRINHIVDSFSMRIPKKIRTDLFHKLNVKVTYKRTQLKPFFAVEGIGMVEIVRPKIASIYRASPARTVSLVKRYLRQGIRIAAKADRSFARHMKVWDHLLATTEDEFDFDLRIARSHRTRRWRGRVVMRVTPIAYHYDLLVEDGKSGELVQRHRIKTIKCLFPFFSGFGFTKLRWKKGDIVGLTRDNKQAFRFATGLPA